MHMDKELGIGNWESFMEFDWGFSWAIGVLIVSYDDATSSVGHRLDQGGVLWMQ